VGDFHKFCMGDHGRKILSDHISAKKAGKELKPTGSVNNYRYYSIINIFDSIIGTNYQSNFHKNIMNC